VAIKILTEREHQLEVRRRCSCRVGVAPLERTVQGPSDPNQCGSDDPKLLKVLRFGDVDLSLAGAFVVAGDVAQPPRAARQARAMTSPAFNSRVICDLHDVDPSSPAPIRPARVHGVGQALPGQLYDLPFSDMSTVAS